MGTYHDSWFYAVTTLGGAPTGFLFSQKEKTMIQNLIDIINFWWLRYLLVTELYMVEKWERILIHVLFVVLFMLFWYFNYAVLLSFTGNLLGVTPISEILQKPSKQV